RGIRSAHPASPGGSRASGDRRATRDRGIRGRHDARPCPLRTAEAAAERADQVSSFRVAVLASGTGTNLQAILDQLHGQNGIEVVAVGSDKPDAMALERATEAGVETRAFPTDAYEDRVRRDGALGDWLDESDADLIVLAGYMQLLSEQFVR